METNSQTFYTSCEVYKGKILYRGYQNGKRIQDKLNYEPYLFFKSTKPTGFKTLSGQHVEQRFYDTISEAKNFLFKNKDISGFEYWGMNNFEYTYINDNFRGEVKFDRSLISVVSLDIELYVDPDATTSINDSNFVKLTEHEINAITIRHNGKAYVFGTKYYKVNSDDVSYYLCKDEQELLYKFLEVWQDIDPDVVTGWNINKFDIPYLINRITNTISEDAAARLSPWFLIHPRDMDTKWGDVVQLWDIQGVTILDYVELYQKFYPSKQESYKLDYIALVELGEKKTDYSEYKNLNDLYDKNFQLFIDYNINDTVLIDKLDAKLGYLNIVFCLAYLYKCNFKDTFGTVKPWDVCIHHILLDQNIVIPAFKMPENIREFAGGFVKDTEAGVYNWLISLDIESSYPHQQISYNISPETIIKGKLGNLTIDQIIDNKLELYRDIINEKNLSVTGNMVCFSKEKQGFMPKILESFFNKRVEYKTMIKKDNIKLIEIEAEISRRKTV